ncbi:unnamed protein product [Lactuca saligna]|uniref:Uncharacterized protein n=1 Tax=Lactuca saligna TaxID=75948 RepID=A0AA35YHH8_LACSI|nr:unnamed protein product [Lactuca saligna]
MAATISGGGVGVGGYGDDSEHTHGTVTLWLIIVSSKIENHRDTGFDIRDSICFVGRRRGCLTRHYDQEGEEKDHVFGFIYAPDDFAHRNQIKMKGFGEFGLALESSEGNDKQIRPRKEVRETRLSDANETFEVTSSEEQEIHRDASSSSRRRQKYRHTRYQIQELEKETPNPDERERLELGRRLNLEANQVKFWFQNRRTHLKTQTDRHENKILREENDNLRLENIAMKEALQKTVCKNCGGPTLQVDRSIHERNLMIENARLKEELTRLTRLIRQLSGRNSSSLATECSAGEARNPIETGLQMGNIAEKNLVSNDSPLIPPPSRSEVGVVNADSMINVPEKTKYRDLASSAMDELMKLGHVDAPLWNRNMETGGETLNFNEYGRSFPPLLGTKPLGFVSEASRATGVVSLRSLDLVEALLDANRWREMFVGMIGSSATLEVISDGAIGGSRNGVLQLMQAEIQLITPSVSARVVKFIRFCRQQADGLWVVVDLSVEAEGREGLMCRRLPSGCILEDLPNGFSKVTWVEHTEYDEGPVDHKYRELVRSGVGFGAQKWICALLRHCEWLRALSSATTANYQLDQHTRSCLKDLARRMTSSFCAGVCLTGGQQWNLVSDAPARIMTRKSMSSPPAGTILSATISIWIPITHRRLFDLLLNKELRCMWDVLCNATGNVAHFTMTHDTNNPNSISLLSSDNPVMVVQETASDMTGSLIVYAPVDLPTVSMMMNNGDTSGVGLLPCGLYIVPAGSEADGSMVTVGFQMSLQDLVTPNLITMDTINTVNNLVSRTVLGIKEIVRSSTTT